MTAKRISVKIRELKIFMAKTKTQNKKTKTKKEALKAAVIFLGGQQFLAREGEEFLVDFLKGKKDIKLKPYLVIDNKKIFIGKPEVKDYTCKLKVLKDQVKGRKKMVFKYKPKTGYHRKKGSRAVYSLVKVESIKKSK